MSAMTSITVNQGPPCTAAAGCDGTDVCVNGGCIPGPDVGGGLSSICQTADQCLSMQCASGGETFMHCVASCDTSTPGSCPNNFECLASGASGVCWPSQGGGCCSASGDPRSSGLLAALVLGGVLRRRRRL